MLCKTLFLTLYWIGRNNTKTIFCTPRTQRKTLFFERTKAGKIISLKRKSFKFILKHFKCHFFSIKISTLLDTVEYQTAAYFDIPAFEKIWKDWYIVLFKAVWFLFILINIVHISICIILKRIRNVDILKYLWIPVEVREWSDLFRMLIS